MTAVRARLDTEGTWPNALIEHAGRWVRLHSTRDPVAEAARLVAAVTDDAPLIVIVGPGLGYVFDALERRSWPGRVLAIDVEPALRSAMQHRRDWAAWGGRLTILDEPSIGGELWRTFGGLTHEPPLIIHPVLERTHHDAVQRAKAKVARAWFDHAANDAARKENAGRYLLNTLRNAAAIAKSGDARTLNGLFVGVPAVIIGAGPSLDRNIEALAAHRDRALLVSVDTALRPLLTAGIAPDLVVAVDPTEANARHLCDLPDCPHTWLVAEGSLDPEALRHFEGRTFFFRVGEHHPWSWLQTQGIDRGVLRAWGSVLTTAFDLALRMAAAPLIFAGADLAFTDERPYARNTTNEESWRHDEAWGVPIEETWSKALAAWPSLQEAGVAGAVTQTAPHLRAFRDWILDRARSTRSCSVVNGTGQGILIGDPIVQRPLFEALAELPLRPDDCTQRIHEAATPRPVPLTTSDLPFADWVAVGSGLSESLCRAAVEGPASSSSASSPFTYTEDERGVAIRDDAAQKEVERLCPGDQNALRRWFGTAAVVWRLVVAEGTAVDLLARLQDEARSLPSNAALLVVDAQDVSCGARLWQALDAFICEHPAASLECRRFLDPDSRLAILRLDGAAHPPCHAPDARKHGELDRDVANRLMPIVARHLHPTSLLDLGCGAGHWMEAARRAGVPRVAGIDGRDVTKGLNADDRFDVCLCVDVAARLGADDHDALLATATAASDVVVISTPPPGQPSVPPHGRSLIYWARKFWSRGYVLEDSLRPIMEQTFGAPQSSSDVLVVFRRVLTPEQAIASNGVAGALRSAMLAHAARIHDLWMQALWLRQRQASPPRVATCRLYLKRHRLDPVDGSTGCAQRRFRFRTAAARSWLVHGIADLQVYEGEKLLPSYSVFEAIADDGHGGCTARRDQIVIASTDGSDPRFNGRAYSILVPAHVAHAENRSLAEVLEHSL